MMHQAIRSSLAALSLALLVSSCGGDDGGGGTGAGGGTSAPAPTPTPVASQDIHPPSISPALPATDFDTFGLVNYIDGEGTVEATTDRFALSWDGKRTYRTAITGVGKGRLRYFFTRPQNDISFSLETAGDDVIPVSIDIWEIASLGGVPHHVHWQYPASGTEDVEVEQLGDAIVGMATTPAQMPTGGSRRYAGEDAGASARLDLNFASGFVNPDFSVSYSDAWGPYEPTPARLISIDFTPGNPEFTGTFQLLGSTEIGTLKGRIFGPDARYMALVLQGKRKSFYDEEVLDFSRVWLLEATD